MRVDLHNDYRYLPLFTPKAAVTDNTAQVSAVIDLQNALGCELVLVTGTLSDADATFATLVEHGDAADFSDAATVPAEDLIGLASGANFTFASDGKAIKIGYKGTKGRLRVTVTPANNTGNLFLAGVAVLGPTRTSPNSTQIL